MKVCLFLNHACNLGCSYCYNGEQFHRQMPLEMAMRGADLALAGRSRGRSASRLSFFGGEPLLEMDLIRQTVAYTEQQLADSKRDDFGFQVVTNGTLLTGEVCDYLLDHGFYMGVSIDGCREAHDATRRFPNGESSYDRVVENLCALRGRDNGTGVKVISVIDPANVDLLASSFDVLVDLGAHNLSMNINYEASWDAPARQRFDRALRQLSERYLATFRDDIPVSLNLFDAKIATQVKGGYALTDRCDFGCEEVAVSPRGRLYPCDRLVGQDDRDDVVIGHIDRGIDRARRDDLIQRKNRTLPDCSECALLHRCMHWCGCVNHAMTGSVGRVEGLLCWFEQKIIEEADRVASILFEEHNGLFLRRFYTPRLRGAGH